MKINKILQDKIKANDTTELEKYVYQDILDSDNPEIYIKDVLNHGCVSGMVSGLIYYSDTKDFYIKYIDDIEVLIEELESNLGEVVRSKQVYPMYNFYAWLAYEEIMRQFADNNNIDY